MVKAAKPKFDSQTPTYNFGVCVPHTVKEAYALDTTNGNDKWAQSIVTELQSMYDYDVFEDLGLGTKPPPDFKCIPVHFVFAVKHDLRHKARLVAGGHLTEPPKDSVYSSVVSLRSLRIIVLLAELNGLKLTQADIGNAYLEAYTKEKIYIIAGPEFGDKAGHTLLIRKALYGLRTSGARFHERLADTLRDLGFTPSYADPNVWMRDAGDKWEFVCVYVDDILSALVDPDPFYKSLTDLGYKLKGVGPPTYHLGGDFTRDPDGTLAWGAKSYITRLLSNYQQMFNHLPKEFTAPLDKTYHPELDTSPKLDADDIRKYQSLLGALQWAISIGRFDIHCSVMTMGRFHAAPHIGQLEAVQQIMCTDSLSQTTSFIDSSYD